MSTAARRMEWSEAATDPRSLLEDDETMPEGGLHDRILLLLVQIFMEWAKRRHPTADVARNMALRWDLAQPQVGVDPDVMVVEPAPPEGLQNLKSLCTWKPGHHPPRLAIEVVSERTALKDYTEAPLKYAASGAFELCVFDPELLGPMTEGGPWLLQLWRRDARGRFVRRHHGDGPAYSKALGAWLRVTDGGQRLRISGARDGADMWLTGEETALREVEQLRAELTRLRGG